MPPKSISLDNIDDDADDTQPLAPSQPAPEREAATPPICPSPVIENDEEEENQGELTPPADLKSAFAMLASANSMPEATKAQQLTKQRTVRFAQEHVCQLQQGLPSLPQDATQYAAQFTAQINSLKSERLTLLAANYPELKELLDENRRLQAENQFLKNKQLK